MPGEEDIGRLGLVLIACQMCGERVGRDLCQCRVGSRYQGEQECIRPWGKRLGQTASHSICGEDSHREITSIVVRSLSTRKIAISVCPITKFSPTAASMTAVWNGTLPKLIRLKTGG